MASKNNSGVHKVTEWMNSTQGCIEFDRIVREFEVLFSGGMFNQQEFRRKLISVGCKELFNMSLIFCFGGPNIHQFITRMKLKQQRNPTQFDLTSSMVERCLSTFRKAGFNFQTNVGNVRCKSDPNTLTMRRFFQSVPEIVCLITSMGIMKRRQWALKELPCDLMCMPLFISWLVKKSRFKKIGFYQEGKEAPVKYEVVILTPIAMLFDVLATEAENAATRYKRSYAEITKFDPEDIVSTLRSYWDRHRRFAKLAKDHVLKRIPEKGILKVLSGGDIANAEQGRCPDPK